MGSFEDRLAVGYERQALVSRPSTPNNPTHIERSDPAEEMNRTLSDCNGHCPCFPITGSCCDCAAMEAERE